MMEWPYKDRPGVPLCPEQDRWHWVKARPEKLSALREKFPALWTAGNQHWIRGTYAPEYAAENWLYLGPVLTPDEAAGLRTRAVKWAGIVGTLVAERDQLIGVLQIAIERSGDMEPRPAWVDGACGLLNKGFLKVDRAALNKAEAQRQTTTDEAFAAALRSIEEKRLVDEYAIKLAGGLTKWHLLPSFKDHFTNGKSHEELRDRARKLLLSMRPADKDLREPACVERWPECESGLYDPRCCRYPKACSCDSAAIFAAFQEANNAEAKP